MCFPACCIYFLPSTESTFGFSDVNCSVFSDSGTEKHSTSSSDEDEIEPLSTVEPPVEGTPDGNNKGLETGISENNDDDIVVSKKSPVLHKIEAKNQLNKPKQIVQEEEMQLEDILEPANIHSRRENEISHEARKVEEDSILTMGTGINAPIVERLELPASSDSETENLRRSSSDTGLLYP